MNLVLYARRIYTSRSARVADKIIRLSVSTDSLHPSWGHGERT